MLQSYILRHHHLNLARGLVGSVTGILEQNADCCDWTESFWGGGIPPTQKEWT